MADEDARRGVRALVSGGVYGIDNDGLEALSRAVADAKRERGLDALDPASDYLLRFSALCEQYITSRCSHRAALEGLDELNKEFEGRISDKVKRSEIPAPWGARASFPEDYGVENWDELDFDLDEYERDGWMPSSIC